MPEIENRKDSLDLLKAGKAPDDLSLVKELSCGINDLSDFLSQHYLSEYISQGGSKIKFVTGHAGAGKTHLMRLIEEEAKKKGFLTVTFSAQKVWLNDFRDIYLEILERVDLPGVLERGANMIIDALGEEPDLIAKGSTFMDYLSQEGKADALSKGSIREELRKRFIKNRTLDHNFALSCSLLTGGILGYPNLEQEAKDTLIGFLYGDKSIRLTQFRKVGLSPTRITKFNSRNMLRSLTEVTRICGYQGVVVMIDDMEILMSKEGSGDVRYTKLKRDDAYQSIRQLVDDIDNMSNISFFLGFHRELMDHQTLGLPSYPALWMRIQNEVLGNRFNKFADIIDLDRYASQFYTPQVLVEMSEKLCAYLKEQDTVAKPLTLSAAKALLDKASFSAYGLPYMVNRAVLEGGKA